jgi:hypothetical protein
MPVTRHPPHRSQRALLTHWAPASDHDAQAFRTIGMEDSGIRVPSAGRYVRAHVTRFRLLRLRYFRHHRRRTPFLKPTSIAPSCSKFSSARPRLNILSSCHARLCIFLLLPPKCCYSSDFASFFGTITCNDEHLASPDPFSPTPERTPGSHVSQHHSHPY